MFDIAAAGTAFAIAVSPLGNDDTLKGIKFDQLTTYFDDKSMAPACKEKKCDVLKGV